jgi:hypothetical protein
LAVIATSVAKEVPGFRVPWRRRQRVRNTGQLSRLDPFISGHFSCRNPGIGFVTFPRIPSQCISPDSRMMMALAAAGQRAIHQQRGVPPS